MPNNNKVFFLTNALKDLLPHPEVTVTDNPSDATILVLGAQRPALDTFSSVKHLYRYGVGSDNVDFEYLKAHNIGVSFPSDATKRIIYEATADFAAFLVLNYFLGNTRGDPVAWKKVLRDSLQSKKVLIIGTGNIGRAVHHKLTPFVQVLTFDAKDDKPNELEPLMRQADVITLHIPGGPGATGLIDAEKLSWLKDGAHIVNTARGELVDEDALFEKLNSSRCTAAFDVFWKEPYKGKLSTLPQEKFQMTPHTASNTSAFQVAAFDEIIALAKNI